MKKRFCLLIVALLTVCLSISYADARTARWYTLADLGIEMVFPADYTVIQTNPPSSPEVLSQYDLPEDYIDTLKEQNISFLALNEDDPYVIIASYDLNTVYETNLKDAMQEEEPSLLTTGEIYKDEAERIVSQGLQTFGSQEFISYTDYDLVNPNTVYMYYLTLLDGHLVNFLIVSQSGDIASTYLETFQATLKRSKFSTFEYPISTDISKLEVKSGQNKTVKIEYSGKSTLYGQTDNSAVCTCEWGSYDGNKWDLKLKAAGAGQAVVKIYEGENPENSINIYVTVEPSALEIATLRNVHYISDRDFEYNDTEDAYILFFSLKDNDENRLDAPMTVDIRIENDCGETVYKKTKYVAKGNYSTWTNLLYGERLLATIYIDPTEIIKGKSSNGTVYFTVHNDGYVSFDESKIVTTELPKIDATANCSLTIMNELPVEVSNYDYTGDIKTTVEISDITYQFDESYDGTLSLVLNLTGKKTFSQIGDSNSEECVIGYKLYDAEDYLVKSNYCLTSALETGEKFKNCQITIYPIEPGSYKLKLFDPK